MPVGNDAAVWITVLSPIDTSFSILFTINKKKIYFTAFRSPRTTDPYQKKHRVPALTSPAMVALGAI
jgi:hypothetical protein